MDCLLTFCGCIFFVVCFMVSFRTTAYFHPLSFFYLAFFYLFIYYSLILITVLLFWNGGSGWKWRNIYHGGQRTGGKFVFREVDEMKGSDSCRSKQCAESSRCSETIYESVFPGFSLWYRGLNKKKEKTNSLKCITEREGKRGVAVRRLKKEK